MQSPPLTISEISRKTGVTRATLTKWRDVEGLDIQNLEAVRERALFKHPARSEGGDDLRAARVRKLLAEAQLAEMKADQQEGKLIALDDICHCLTKIGATLKAQLSKLRAELPPMLYGLSQAEMTKRIGETTDRVLTDICADLESVRTDPPKPE
jgi:hypothetical protein